MDEAMNRLDTLTQVEKEALSYRLLIERDKINDALRQVQRSMEAIEPDA